MLNPRNTLSLELLLTVTHTLVQTKAIKIGRSELILDNRTPEYLHSTVPEARAKKTPRFHCNSPTGDSMLRWGALNTLTKSFCSNHGRTVDMGNLVNYESLLYYDETKHIATSWHQGLGKIPNVYKYRISSQVNCVPEGKVYDLRGQPHSCIALFEHIWTDCK